MLKPTFTKWLRIRLLNILWGVNSPAYGNGKQGWQKNPSKVTDDGGEQEHESTT